MWRASHRRPTTISVADFIKILRNVHLWLGVVLAPFMIAMAFTGMVINHKGPNIFKQIHTAKPFGHLGRYFLDTIAVGFIALGVSGVLLLVLPKLLRLWKSAKPAEPLRSSH